MQETEFSIDTSEGSLSATVTEPQSATHALLLAHGAGADHKHAHMQALASAFASQNILTMRFNFPFKENGRNRVDSKAVSISCITQVAKHLQANTSFPLLIGGHSFGGRMATHAVAEGALTCDAMILCSFPLHPAGKPSVSRAQHLPEISTPMLFLSGTRDKLAEQELLNQEVSKLATSHKVHWLDTGDHSYEILKRSRKAGPDIYTEAATAARDFLDTTL